MRQHARSADCRRLNCIGEPGDALDGVIGNHHSKFGTMDVHGKPWETSRLGGSEECRLLTGGYAISAGTVVWRKFSTDTGSRPVRFVTVVVTIA